MDTRSPHRRRRNDRTHRRDSEWRPSGISAEGQIRRRAERDQRRRRAKRIALGTVLTLGVILLASAVWAFIFLRGIEGRMQEGVRADEKVVQALAERVPEEPFNLLILGSDSRDEGEAARADTVIVARIDPTDRRVWMLSIPRDARVEIPGSGVNKVNSATALGGPELMIDTVEDFLDLPIHHYMEIDFSGFQGIVDAMGGIYVDVEVEIDDPKAASHSPERRARYIAPGYQLLDGEHALTYVRSRDFPDADFTRMRHQQNFFKALAEQSVRWNNIQNLPRMADEFSRSVTTDMSVSQLIGVAQSMRGMGSGNVQTTTLLGEWRSPYVVVDDALKQYLVQQMLAGGSIEATAVPEPELVPADITVTVRNGAGIAGVASQAAARLQARGFQVGEVGNANQFVYDDTLVVYAESEAAAQAVADALPMGRLVPSRGMYAFETDVLVVVGKDWVGAAAP